MGADIPDVEVVVQFGVPSSLSVFKQQIGCAGRDPCIQAEAVLLVEVSMFQWKKQQNKKADLSNLDNVLEVTSDGGEDRGDDEDEGEAVQKQRISWMRMGK
ncbi:hypothetical protein V5O48_011384, partial [Marasmius crinis-equi]